jgi:hypothetical protein
MKGAKSTHVRIYQQVDDMSFCIVANLTAMWMKRRRNAGN